MKIGKEKPKGELKHGKDSAGKGALYFDQDEHQVAQLDDKNSGKGFGWWKFPKGTFK